MVNSRLICRLCGHTGPANRSIRCYRILKKSYATECVLVVRLFGAHVSCLICDFLLRHFEYVFHRNSCIPNCETYMIYIYTTIGGPSSKFDEFLAERSQFDSDRGVDCSTPTSCQSTTLVRPLFELYCTLFFYENK